MFEKLNSPIIVLFGEEEKKDFKNKCRAAGVDASSKLRSFARKWMTEEDDKRRKDQNKYRSGVNVMPMFAPTRRFKGSFNVRL